MAEHSAVNRRVVGSSPTWGVKRKRIIRRMVLFLFLLRKFCLNKSLHRKSYVAVNCKDAETLAVRGGVRRLWRSGRSNIAVAIVRGYRKSHCVGFSWFEPNLGSNKRRPPYGGLFCYSFKLDLTHTIHRTAESAVNCIPSHPLPVAEGGGDGMAQRSTAGTIHS